MRIDKFIKIIDKTLKSDFELDCFADMENKILGYNYTENIRVDFQLLSENTDFVITVDVGEIINGLDVKMSHFVFFRQDKIWKKLYKLHNFLLVQYFIKHHKFHIISNTLLLNKKSKNKSATLII